MDENNEEEVLNENASNELVEEGSNSISLNENTNNSSKKNKKVNKKIIIILIIVLLVLTLVGFFVYKNYFSKPVETITTKTKAKEVYSKYRMSGNKLEDFDLSFLQLENNSENTLYSPLSIKYALEMLSEGAKGETKTQIDSIIGEYKANKYINSSNMSFANAMFIRNSYKDNIKDTYIHNLSSKYNAEIIYDSFENPNNLNSWVNNKTFGLINNLFDDISQNQYILVNALAIDMEWNKVIQADGNTDYSDLYSVSYPHENYNAHISPINENDYPSMQFNNNMNVKSVEIGASINNYDIIKEIGEENIRKTVGDGYEQWKKENLDECGADTDVNTFLDNYIKELGSNYKSVKASTDFSFYNDDEIKVFSKDLKQYNNTTLQYIGIMPKNVELTDYISNTNASKINDIISKIKTIELNNFEYGKVYKIIGNIPLFKFEYDLNLMSDLKELGIKNVFDTNKADLSNLTKQKGTYIDTVAHKANIEFSNQGIKAAAATQLGGAGATSCGYDYFYDVPVETIDMTFDKPYLFLIRDKVTGEVWFSGKVYQPTAN